MRFTISSTITAFLCLLLALAPSALLAMPKQQSQSQSQASVLSGKVKETMNASGYTYMQVETGGKDIWVAIPETPVKKGSTVNYYEGMEMVNFNSKTLGRTFDSIIFSSGLAQEAHAKMAKSAPAEDDSFAAALESERSSMTPDPINDTQASGGSAGAIVPLTEISIGKASGPNGYSVEELFNKAKELSGKKVQVKGKVVKVSPAIMGRNWVHLQDGTGNPMQNTHDLVVTTNETVELDTTVTFEGIITANKDFGAGYKYDAIVEKAAVIK